MADYYSGRHGKDTSARNDASNTDLLLHPELLSRDFIQLVLHERKIGVGECSKASRDQLTDLYLQHVIPLPQRDLPDSRWGRRTGRNRPCPSQGHTHRGTHGSGGENARKRPLIVFDSGSTSTAPLKLKKPGDSGSDRLKSPPSGILANPIRKLSSNPPGTPVSPTSVGTDGSPAGNGRAGSSPPAVATAAVRVKRHATQEQECDSSGEPKSPEAKKKIQHVTWP